MDIIQKIATELSTAPQQIQAAVHLLDDGATVPFIARYRKEITGGLSDSQLRLLVDRLQYLRDIEARKKTILKAIEEQGKLTDTLRAAIDNTDNKTALEDLYLPYKPKRRTKAQIARSQGLQPLADVLLNQVVPSIESVAQSYLNDTITDVQAALEGARAIVIEHFSEQAQLIGILREKLWTTGQLSAKVIAEQEIAAEKFKDYFDYQEPIRQIPSHRILAILRGRNEKLLQVAIQYRDDDTPTQTLSDYESAILKYFDIERLASSSAYKWLVDTVRLAWRAKIFPSLELETINRLKEIADQDAIGVFAKNLKDLLLAAPAGGICTMGLDPGFRTGIKVAIVNETGKLLDTAVVYLHQESKTLERLTQLIQQYSVQLIAIGNGTASRETDKLVGQLLKNITPADIKKIIVSEAGASVYSASELASTEFPNLDVSLRGAVSIARRLQDPLAELVKIDPKSIGVGQYQHDVNQVQLAKALDAVVEDCVNAVGVDVNTASASLLARVSGLNHTLAHNIIRYRDEYGIFSSRQSLRQVPRFGDKTFEQAAGFLRINGGIEPLDASAVHPESYPLVHQMLADHAITAQELIGNREKISRIQTEHYINAQVGLPTIRDILNELEKPGRDPRGIFKTAQFNDEINEINDLRVGMILEGVVTNVANFGAFVDIGVHQDGLVHISAMSQHYIDNPRKVVKTGDIIQVRVLEVDTSRKRIALSMKLQDDSTQKPARNTPKKPQHSSHNAMSAAFAKIKAN